MTASQPAGRQSGVALIGLLVLLVLAAGYALFRQPVPGSRLAERERLLIDMTKAREALIAYAVQDASRPGRLPCPNQDGTGVSPLFSGDDCRSYSGLLPWKTLDLVETTDRHGVGFGYTISPAFGGQHDDVPLNSETVTVLRLDRPPGSASNDVVAVIIAARGPIDPRNADGDDYFHNGGSEAPEDNDIVLPITRQELMAAVEQRIANELRGCLEQHAASADNTEHSYPWPATLASGRFTSQTGSLFGRVPETQAANPEQTLQASTATLTATRTTLSSAVSPAEQLAAVSQLQTQVAYARALYDHLYLNAALLNTQATATKTAFNQLEAVLQSGDATRLPAATDAALPSLLALRDSLKHSGNDLFLTELRRQNITLRNATETARNTPTATNFRQLLTPVQILGSTVLELSSTPSQGINDGIASAHDAASAAFNSVRAARDNPSEPWITQALADAGLLYSRNLGLESLILGSRSNLDAADLTDRATRLGSALSVAVAASYSATSLKDLISVIESSRSLVANLSTSTLSALRSSTLADLDSALAAATAAGDPELIRQTGEAAAAQMNALANALRGLGDNVAYETLNTAYQALNARPADVALLGDIIRTVLYWADIAISQTADLARTAKKGLTAQENSDTSAYTAANRLLASMDGDQDSIALLEKAVDKPDDEAAQQAAREALSETQTKLDAVLAAASRLDGKLDTSLALAGAPMVWFSTACAFLQPSSGTTPGWWATHGWAGLIFYQISDRIRLAAGTLSVNGRGSYRVVAVAAGGPLFGLQNRVLGQIGQYLEKSNADASRDGDAQSPIPRFVTDTVSPTFNDRLAY